METNTLSCDIVRDLLPLYTEKLVSEGTAREIEAHLESCETCRAALSHENEAVPVPVKENLKEARPIKKLRLHMLFNILGSPLWLPLLAAALIVVFALYACVWAVALCFWCVPVALSSAFLFGTASAAFNAASGAFGTGVLIFACALVCAGLAILTFVPCLLFTKCVLKLTSFLTKKIPALLKRNKEKK